jgi:SAM-dependent methyltransferase
MSLIYHQRFDKGIYGKYLKVAHLLPPRASVLEIGCHTGYFSQFLQGQGFDVIGLENNVDAVRVAQEKGVTVLFGDIESPDLMSGLHRTFDVILLMDVLEHLRDPAIVLNRLMPLLSDQGVIIITGPNISYWAVRKDLLLGKWEYTETGILDRTHLHLYGAADWKRLVVDAGYDICKFDVAEGFLPIEHILLRIPLIRAIIPVFRDLAFRYMPELFATVYLIEIIISKEIK